MEDPPAGLVVDFDGVLDLEALGGVLLRALRRILGLLMHLDAAGVAGGAWSALSAVRYVGVAALERVEQ
eukprot:scaffold170436_cov18-Tisochrysis_lutea.AAC.2